MDASRITFPLQVMCPGAKEFGGQCPNTVKEWIWSKCKHPDYLTDEGDCLCKEM